MKIKKQQRRQGGLSLVELMIAMVLGLLLLAGVVEIFLSSRASYRLTDALSEVQSNGRFAVGFITHNARMAGYVGCNADLGPPKNVLNNAASYPFNFEDGVRGYDAQSYTTGSWLPTDGTLPASFDPVYGTDVLSIRSMQGQGITITQGMPVTSAELVVSSTGDLKDGDIVMISDCSSATVFEVTQVQESAGHIQHRKGGPTGTPGNSDKYLGSTFQQGAMIQKITNISYFIHASDGSHSCDGGSCGLWRKVGGNDAQELVHGVTNMQILYGYDSGLDGVLDDYRTAKDVAGDWKSVVSVRIALLVTSSDTATTKPASAPSYTLLDKTVTVPNDMHLRQVFTKTIALRNKQIRN